MAADCNERVIHTNALDVDLSQVQRVGLTVAPGATTWLSLTDKTDLPLSVAFLIKLVDVMQRHCQLSFDDACFIVNAFNAALASYWTSFLLSRQQGRLLVATLEVIDRMYVRFGAIQPALNLTTKTAATNEQLQCHVPTVSVALCIATIAEALTRRADADRTPQDTCQTAAG